MTKASTRICRLRVCRWALVTNSPTQSRASFSGGGGEQCVEIAELNGDILMRESDAPNTITTTSRAKFAAFIAGVKSGEFDHFAN
ncbi:DUF397 domain-containing protein [Streptomyces sp. S4.7]|uniref:DUF397 domain-containing protein n=1 Tax=Streptomyces sp. S4.7 TaxID=2705439 RepID=UPI0031BA9140